MGWIIVFLVFCLIATTLVGASCILSARISRTEEKHAKKKYEAPTITPYKSYGQTTD